jgi:hypothetical protein
MPREADSIHEEHGNVQFNYAVAEDKMNSRLQEFMSSPRPFTSYPADRLEVVARHYNLIPENAYYVGYDANTQVLWFKVNNRAHGEPRWKDAAKGFIARILGK